MDQHRFQPKTHIAQVSIANARLYTEVAQIMKLKPAQVREMVHFTGEFIYDMIGEGLMQGVMLPYFGKIKPKKKYIQQLKRFKTMKHNGMTKVYKALRGHPIDASETQTNP